MDRESNESDFGESEIATRRLTRFPVFNKTRNTTYCKIPLFSWLYAAAILEICKADELAGLKVARQVAFGQLTI